MGLNETLIFYLLIGLAVAVATYLSEERQGWVRSAFLLGSGCLFWPLYLSLLLSARKVRPGVLATAAPQSDEMATAIAQVERELDAAFGSLDGWAENVLASEHQRLAELRQALAGQAARIRDMDLLLASAGAEPSDITLNSEAATPTAQEALDRSRRSRQARMQNVARLAAVRRQSHADLLATLAWIRELVSMIHLAKFTGAPASRAEELVGQIAAAVEGVSAVAWHDPESIDSDPPASPVAAPASIAAPFKTSPDLTSQGVLQ